MESNYLSMSGDLRSTNSRCLEKNILDADLEVLLPNKTKYFYGHNGGKVVKRSDYKHKGPEFKSQSRLSSSYATCVGVRSQET